MPLLVLAALAPASGSGRSATPAAQTTTITYLPLVLRPRYPTPFAFQMLWFDTYNVGLAQAAAPAYVRSAHFDWAKIEPVLHSPRQYQWSQVPESSMAYGATQGLNYIGVVRNAPDWALQTPGIPCGKIAAAALDEYAVFLEALVKRFSVPPYGIRYWQLGNEPDIDPSLVPANSPYGCWGDQTDPYYGGGYYAEMLKAAYPAIKRGNPDAQVVLGGLLLDCDPANPPDEPHSCLPSMFLEGALVNGGGSYFDILAYHGYAYYDEGQVWDETHPYWAARGGVVLGKQAYLQEVLAKYGLSKPMMMTEASLVCPEWSSDCQPPGSVFFETQADYVVKVYARAWGAGLQSVVWYALDDTTWRYSSLLGGQTPRPSYYAFATMANKLSDARGIGGIGGFPGVTVYEFALQGMKVWLMWSSDGQPHSVTLPAKTLGVTDKYGNVIPPQNGQVTVNSPIYVDHGY